MRANARHKNLITALNEKGTELLSFKNSIYKEKCEAFSKIEIEKETLSAICFKKISEVEALFSTFGISIVLKLLWR